MCRDLEMRDSCGFGAIRKGLSGFESEPGFESGFEIAVNLRWPNHAIRSLSWPPPRHELGGMCRDLEMRDSCGFGAIRKGLSGFESEPGFESGFEIAGLRIRIPNDFEIIHNRWEPFGFLVGHLS